MAYSVELAAASIAICLVSVTHKKRAEHSRLSKSVRQHGCEPATRYPNRDPFLGLDLFAILRKADSSGRRSHAYTKSAQEIWADL